jgi:hypothetical protein
MSQHEHPEQPSGIPYPDYKHRRYLWRHMLARRLRLLADWVMP